LTICWQLLVDSKKCKLTFCNWPAKWRFFPKRNLSNLGRFEAISGSVCVRWDNLNSLVGAQLHCCNTLQFTATHCNTLQRTATHYKTLQRTATHCNTLQRSATHCNALQNTATRCNIWQVRLFVGYDLLQHTASHCNTLQHTATRCNTLQHTASPRICGIFWKVSAGYSMTITSQSLVASHLHTHTQTCTHAQTHTHTHTHTQAHTNKHIHKQSHVRNSFPKRDLAFEGI